MPREIERKFLVTGEYKSQAFAHSRIVQGYICSARGRTVRVRLRDGRGYLTIKGASDVAGMSRYEWEKEISREEAEELMKLCEEGVIDKTRYLVRSGSPRVRGGRVLRRQRGPSDGRGGAGLGGRTV